MLCNHYERRRGPDAADERSMMMMMLTDATPAAKRVDGDCSRLTACARQRVNRRIFARSCSILGLPAWDTIAHVSL